MRRQAVVVALLAGGIALLGPAAAPGPASAGIGGTTDVATVAAPAVPAPAAQTGDSDDGLKAEAKTTYVVDPPARKIHVTTNVTLTNQVADVNRGNVVEQYYFYQYAVPVLAEAEGTRAQRSDGTALTVSLHASEDAAQRWIKFAQVDLAPRLLYGESQAIVLSYDLPYQKPRSDGLSRANDALVTFPAFSAGDANLTSIEVRLPSTFDVEVVGDPLDQQERDGQTVLTAGPIENPDTFTAIVVATDDERLVSKDIQVEGRDVEVRAWPDDAEWATFVANQLGATMPALEGLIGQPWPTERGLVVVETGSPYAHGYAGWYSQVDHSISLGDELDPLVIAHELSHVWFNANLFDARWINEGLADEYAQTTLQQLQKPTADAAAPDLDGPGAVSLNDWSTPSLLEQQDDATEAYGYATSWYVMDQLAAEIGVDKMRAVIDAVTREQIPYVGDPDDPETMDGVANWQRLLDQLENVGGSRRATELFTAYVANDTQKPTLAARTEARLAYAGLVERGGEWSPPLLVRADMSHWSFDEAGAAVLQANAVLDVRDDIDEVLEGHDVGDLALEDTYESADDMTELSAEADETLDAARAYRDADDRMDRGAGVIGAIGLLGSGTGGQLDEAADQLEEGDPEASLDASASVEDHLDSATRNGLLRVAGLLVVLGGLIWVIRYRRGGDRRRQRTAEAEIAQLEAMYARRPASPPPAGDAAWRHMDPDHPN